jgi:hypothetical protein
MQSATGDEEHSTSATARLAGFSKPTARPPALQAVLRLPHVGVVVQCGAGKFSIVAANYLPTDLGSDSDMD